MFMKEKPLREKERKMLANKRVSPKGILSKSLFMQEMEHRAETMTPLLKEILDFRPSPRWT